MIPPVTELSHAVFLSYASQDAEAAQKICDALRAAGIEVFLDQSELRGGDAWDQKIRHEIHDCALFIPLVSQHTQERLEGYFRHEWNLAIERTHHMAQQKPFLVPVVVDGTRDQEAFVPDTFRAVQWTRLPGGETPPAFVERVKRLLSPELSPMSAVSGATPAMREPVRATWRSKPVLLAIIAVIVFAALAYFVAKEFGIPKHTTPETAARVSPGPAAFAPPPHSVAVLPFVNMSGDKDQEYFSEGLTEELLNSLSRINELQVAARTSSFSFQGEHPDIATVAHKLNVGAVPEGSVRRSANTVRVTAQLINGVTGFHVWSQTYDRDLGNVLQLQTDIATAVASVLKVALIGDEASKIEVGGTRNPAAFDAYLRATKSFRDRNTRADVDAAIANYTKAIELDPKYALAYADRSYAIAQFAADYAASPAIRSSADKAEADARKAIALAPELGLGHLALGSALETVLDFGPASTEFERASRLEPGNARILLHYGYFAVCMGQAEVGLNALRRALTLDPLNVNVQNNLGLGLLLTRRNEEALGVLKRAHTLYPENSSISVLLGISQYRLGDYQGALKSCDQPGDEQFLLMCLAITYEKLGRHTDAEAMLKKIPASEGNAALLYACIFAQWGQINRALDSLETAMRLRSPYLDQLKMDEIFDPIRNEPRFQAVERALKFPK